MAEGNESEERSEEASPERREEFRQKGQLAVSREINGVAVLASSIIFLTFYIPTLTQNIMNMMRSHFEQLSTTDVNQESILTDFFSYWWGLLLLIIPICLVTMVAATSSTLLQTRFNWSWKRMAPDFKKMNPLKGLVKMVSLQAVVELSKGVLKMSVVGLVAYLILKGEWNIVPTLMTVPIVSAWAHWLQITGTLFWSVAAMLVFIAAYDYIYNFMQLEKKLKMTKQEVKEEHKKREVDPHVKGKIRRLQREMASKKMVEATKDATVIITNPTHYAVALKYEVGMGAPIVVAKGIDFLALRIKETAKEHEIEIVENKPLARTLYKLAEIGEEIPESLYRAVSEIIRYVFHIRGIRLPKKKLARSSI